MAEQLLVAALDPDEPSGDSIKYELSRNFLDFGKRGRVSIADFALYGRAMLLDPDYVFRGITEDIPLLNPVSGDDDGMAYVKRIPMRHRESSQGHLYNEAARGSETYVVYVYSEGIVAASRFEPCDSKGRPSNWETRFRELVYSAPRVGTG